MLSIRARSWERYAKEITPVFGWGTIPDQYGRIAPDADDPTLE